MKQKSAIIILLAGIFAFATVAFAAYHHEGEKDADKFLSVYPEAAGTKLDHCALCHCGGEYESKGKMVSLGSCQWCHYSYGYDGAGDIETTINAYGADYKSNGRNAAAVDATDTTDSDGDGYTNEEEIQQSTFPGNAEDHPGLTEAPHRIYTKAQLLAMPLHTEFLMMNTSRSGDFYAEYTGVPMKDLLDDAGILASATGITVYAPDGWAQTHPLYYEDSPETYHVYGDIPGQSYQYPPATYFYNDQADQAKNTADGWCDYSAASCIGRSHGSAIAVTGGLKAILALKREGVALDSGVLTDENKLDGEGPYRVVVPQKVVTAPDQSSKASNQAVIWPYNFDWDHNAGACTRTVTIIKVDPLPEGMTDIDVLEAGWTYVDSEKIIVYGAIDGTDSNGNGILDSEEGADDTKDFDKDGIADYKDSDTASFRPANGIRNITINTNEGDLANLQAYADTDPAISQVGKPAISYPYGAVKFTVTGIDLGSSVEVSMVFPDNVPKYAQFYKITSTGWHAVDFGSNNGDNTITIKLTDGDPNTDADGVENGVIVDPSALGIPAEPEDDDDDDDSCFIMTLF
ncbi:MAG: GEGP motif-containing diheme protein [Desulfosalsimonadaceae bacterium]|nr:GEGP motif-containing diheme protein [Desulfosalsimonadaceae bacterium]